MRKLFFTLVSALSISSLTFAQDMPKCDGFKYNLSGYELFAKSAVEQEDFVSKYYFKKEGGVLWIYELAFNGAQLEKVFHFKLNVDKLKEVSLDGALNIEKDDDVFQRASLNWDIGDMDKATYSVHYCGSGYEPSYDTLLYTLEMNFIDEGELNKFLKLIDK